MAEKIKRAELYSETEIDPKLFELMETLATYDVGLDSFVRNLRWRELLKNGEYRSEVPNIAEISLRAGFPKILKETVMVSSGLIQQKVLSDIVAGTELLVDYRDLCRVEEMDAPKIEIPIIDRLDFVFKPGGQRGSAQSMGGQIPKAELDASGETGMYRGEINIPKSWIRDSNFAAVEETLNVAGQAVAVTVEKKVIDDLISNASQTDTKANLDGVSALFFEAFVEVVDNKLPSNGFICDTAVFHPADYAALVRENSSGNFPWYNSLYRDKVAGRDGLFFQGVRSPVKIIVADADAATVDTVMFYNRLKALALGIRQDLTIEDFDDVRQGIEGAVLTMQFVTAEIRDKAAYKATVW